jgi:hypothetical protein
MTVFGNIITSLSRFGVNMLGGRPSFVWFHGSGLRGAPGFYCQSTRDHRPGPHSTAPVARNSGAGGERSGRGYAGIKSSDIDMRPRSLIEQMNEDQAPAQNGTT